MAITAQDQNIASTLEMISVFERLFGSDQLKVTVVLAMTTGRSEHIEGSYYYADLYELLCDRLMEDTFKKIVHLEVDFVALPSKS